MKLFFSCFLMLLSIISTAQEFTLEPVPAFVEGIASNQPLIALAEITNNTDSTQVVVWQRLSGDIPTGWESGVCTSLGCFLTDVSEGEFPMIPLETLNLDVQFETYGIAGTGIVEVKLFFEGDSTNFRIGTYEANATAVDVENPETKSVTLLYPNPCEEYCYITNTEKASSFVIHSVLGTSVKAGIYTDTGIYVGDLLAGNYYISLLDRTGEKFATLSFTKS